MDWKIVWMALLIFLIANFLIFWQRSFNWVDVISSILVLFIASFLMFWRKNLRKTKICFFISFTLAVVSYCLSLTYGLSPFGLLGAVFTIFFLYFANQYLKDAVLMKGEKSLILFFSVILVLRTLWVFFVYLSFLLLALGGVAM